MVVVVRRYYRVGVDWVDWVDWVESVALRPTTQRVCSGLCLVRDSVVECGSPLPLLEGSGKKQQGPPRTFR